MTVVNIKKQKAEKGMIKKLTFENYKNWLEETQCGTKISHLEKIKFT